MALRARTHVAFARLRMPSADTSGARAPPLPLVRQEPLLVFPWLQRRPFASASASASTWRQCRPRSRNAVGCRSGDAATTRLSSARPCRDAVPSSLHRRAFISERNRSSSSGGSGGGGVKESSPPPSGASAVGRNPSGRDAGGSVGQSGSSGPAAGASTSSSSSSSSSLWPQLRTPALFGMGLYLGLVLFGQHRETKEGSQFLAELKDSFDDRDKKR